MTHLSPCLVLMLVACRKVLEKASMDPATTTRASFLVCKKSILKKAKRLDHFCMAIPALHLPQLWQILATTHQLMQMPGNIAGFCGEFIDRSFRYLPAYEPKSLIVNPAPARLPQD